MQRLQLTLTSLLVLLLAPLSSALTAEEGFDHDHGRWTRVLGAVATTDGVDYERLAKERKELDSYLSLLEQVAHEEFGTWERDERYAFWINAYNAYTLRLVIDHLPVESIRDIGDEETSPWDLRVVGLAHLAPGIEEKQLTLNELEHRILRAEFKDARVHAAVNCASKGCPPLRTSAFTAGKLGEQLDAAARAWLADPARFRFDPRKNRVVGSEILRWFESDFVRDAESTALWIARFAPEEHRDWLRKGPVQLEFLPYDWKLNSARKKP